MDMVEKVARAIAQADEQNGGPPYEYRITLDKHSKEQLFDEAKAAIEAMMEPTFRMIMEGQESICEGIAASGSPVPVNVSTGSFKVVYQAMIKAALEEGE